MKCIATFDTTSMALMFERACRKEGFKVRIIPVPRAISASCGLACSYQCDDEEKIQKISEDKNLEVTEFHHI